MSTGEHLRGMFNITDTLSNGKTDLAPENVASENVETVQSVVQGIVRQICGDSVEIRIISQKSRDVGTELHIEFLGLEESELMEKEYELEQRGLALDSVDFTEDHQRVIDERHEQQTTLHCRITIPPSGRMRGKEMTFSNAEDALDWLIYHMRNTSQTAKTQVSIKQSLENSLECTLDIRSIKYGNVNAIRQKLIELGCTFIDKS